MGTQISETQDGVGCQDRGCENGVCIDQVVHHAEENEHHTEAEGNTSQDRNDPVDARRVSPCEPEETNGHCDTAKHGRRQTSLGGCEALVFVAQLCVTLVIPDTVDDSNDHSNGHTNKGKTTNTWAPAAVLLVDDREGTEKHVQGAVNNGHVNADKEDDRLAEEQDPGTRERSLEDLAESGRALVNIATALVDLSGTP